MFSQGSSGGASRPPTVVSSAPVIEDILRRGASCTIHHDRKHAVGTTYGVVATAIPEMGCRRDSTVMAGCAGRTPRTPAAVATVTTPSKAVSAVATKTTRNSNRPRPGAAACYGSTMLRQHSCPVTTPSNVVSAVSTTTTRVPTWSKPGAPAGHRAMLLPQHSILTVPPVIVNRHSAAVWTLIPRTTPATVTRANLATTEVANNVIRRAGPQEIMSPMGRPFIPRSTSANITRATVATT